MARDTEGCAEGKSRIGWRFFDLECGKCEGNVKFNVNGAPLKAAATDSTATRKY